MKRYKLNSTGSLPSCSWLNTIFWSGLISGILDALAACIVYYYKQGFNPGDVMKYIASGLYGPAAFVGGNDMIIKGFLLHFLTAFVIAGSYYIIYPKVRMLKNKPFWSGIIFGTLVWIVMSFIIIPSTAVPKSPFTLIDAMIGVSWHMFLVGLPIAVITKKAYSSY